jgi:hypothetical protein
LQRRASILATVAVLAGCGHGEPFQTPDPFAHGPLVPGVVARVTYSAGRDQSPGWRADGSGILYTYEDLTTTVRGWCLGILPAEGGSRTQSRCGRQVADSVHAWDRAAESADGRVAFLRSISRSAALVPYDWSLMVGPSGDPAAASPILPIPFTPPSGPPIKGIGQIHWLDASTLIVLAESRFVGRPCRACAVDTVATGRMLYTIPAAGGTPVPVPGTDYASGVAVRGPDEIFFTRGGDAHVYRRALASGVTTAVLDFTGLGIVRDVAVAGDRLIAVVGGSVTWGFDPLVGDSTQADSGGVMVDVDLTRGTAQAVDVGFAVRRPALAPNARSVVVETAARPADLYLVQLP